MAQGSRRFPRRARALSGLLATALLGGGCFEEPVREELTLSFTPEHEVLASWELRLAASASPVENRALLDRIDRIDEALAGGWHPWAVRFDQLAADDGGASWRRADGHLAHYRRWAILEDPEAVSDLLAGSSLGASWAASRGAAELVLYPSTASRATRDEIDRVHEALDSFAESLSAYLDAGAELWAYLETRPGRRRACLARFFDLEGGGALRPREETLVEALEETSTSLLEIVILEPGRAETLDEISRRVFDPFPLDVVVEPAGPILEVDGFLRSGKDSVRAPRFGLWSAFASLEGRWLSPDPILAWVRHDRSESDRPFPLDSFLERAFAHRAAPPPFDVRDALLAALEPRTTYRVLWRIPATGEPPPNAGP